MNDNRSEYETFISHLKSKGVEDYNCWQFMKGHDVLDEIGIKIAAHISNKYRGEYLQWLHANVADPTRKEDLLKKFNNSTRVADGVHQLKDRIREILYDIKPDLTWGASINNDNQIQAIFQ